VSDVLWTVMYNCRLGISEKSNTHVKIEIKIMPKASIQKYLSHRPGRLSVSVSLLFMTTPYRLIFLRSRAIV